MTGNISTGYEGLQVKCKHTENISKWQLVVYNDVDVIMIISVIFYILTNYLGMTLIYLMAYCFFDESEGVYANVKLGIL